MDVIVVVVVGAAAVAVVVVDDVVASVVPIQPLPVLPLLLLILIPILLQIFAVLRVELYGGGAGVAAGLAVLGGGNGGSDAFDVLKYGLQYAALYRGSMLRPFCSNG